MNDEQAALLIDVLKRLNDRLDEITSSLHDLENAVGNICGAIEHVTGNIGPNGCVKVKVLP